MIVMSFKQTKAGFFDRDAVKGAMGRRTHAALSKFGAFTMTTARRSLKTNPGTSAPGSPPFSHVGTLKRLIFFSYDVRTGSVVIGPTLFTPPARRAGKVARVFPEGGATVPSVLEYGGTGVKMWPSGATKRVRYEARPYMKPAFDENIEALPEVWDYAIKP